MPLSIQPPTLRARGIDACIIVGRRTISDRSTINLHREKKAKRCAYSRDGPVRTMEEINVRSRSIRSVFLYLLTERSCYPRCTCSREACRHVSFDSMYLEEAVSDVRQATCNNANDIPVQSSPLPPPVPVHPSVYNIISHSSFFTKAKRAIERVSFASDSRANFYLAIKIWRANGFKNVRIRPNETCTLLRTYTFEKYALFE